MESGAIPRFAVPGTGTFLTTLRTETTHIRISAFMNPSARSRVAFNASPRRSSGYVCV
jgi:hypothetical protein